MKVVHLHDHLNPDRIIPLDAEDFSCAVPFGSGSTVLRKETDLPLCVHETPEQVEALVEDALNA